MLLAAGLYLDPLGALPKLLRWIKGQERGRDGRGGQSCQGLKSKMREMNPFVSLPPSSSLPSSPSSPLPSPLLSHRFPSLPPLSLPFPIPPFRSTPLKYSKGVCMGERCKRGLEFAAF